MKKYAALLAAVCLALSVSACGSSSSSTSGSASGSAAGSASASGSEASSSAASSSEGTAERTTFTVGFDAEYPPYGYMDDNGDYTGFDLELAQAVCDREGSRKSTVFPSSCFWPLSLRASNVAFECRSFLQAVLTFLLRVRF